MTDQMKRLKDEYLNEITPKEKDLVLKVTPITSLDVTDVVTMFDSAKLCEMLENFYDSEPDIKDEDSSWYFNTDEGQKAYKKLCDEYEPQRLEYNNWIEVYGEGVWFMSQREVDAAAKDKLSYIMHHITDADGEPRFYEYIYTHKHRTYTRYIYFGRDMQDLRYDLVFTFMTI